MSETDKILIIGAGPAGMAAAEELHRAGRKMTVVEKKDVVGGLARTYVFKEGDLEFRTDNGPHRFFSKNPYLYEFIEELIKEQWILVERYTRQYIDGKWYDYPINAGQAFRNIGPTRAARMLVDYARGRIRYRTLGKPIVNFEDYIVANFGRSLGNLNMINYTEKIWGIPANEIHADWAKQRIKGLSLRSTIANTVRKSMGGGSGDSPKSLVDAFWYPDMGTGLIYEAIQERVEGAGNPVLLSTQPSAFRHDGKRITEVDLEGEHKRTIKPDVIVESIPIVEMVKLMDPPPPPEVLQAAASLRYRSQVYLFLTLDIPTITPDQWIYFPEKHIPFGRVCEMRNFSDKMSPPGKTSLFVEFFVFEGDDIWTAPKEKLVDIVVDAFERMGFFTRGDVRQTYLLKAKNVYPVYDLDYLPRLQIIKDYLDQFENLFYIGRPGRFRYNNQDHSLEMGMLAAKSILEGKRYDIGSVGSEIQYYEGHTLEKEG